MYQPTKRQDLQDLERPDRVPALPTKQPQDRMPPNMDSHGTEHLQQRFERQDIENGKTSRSPSPTRHARPTPGYTSEHWRVLEVPEGLWCTLHCKAKGCTTRRATWCIGPKPRSTTTAIAEIYPVVAKIARVQMPRGEHASVFVAGIIVPHDECMETMQDGTTTANADQPNIWPRR